MKTTITLHPAGSLAENAGQFVSAAEFCLLAISHRRMVRVDRRAELIRGLQDVETGEVFLIDERRLVSARGQPRIGKDNYDPHAFNRTGVAVSCASHLRTADRSAATKC